MKSKACKLKYHCFCAMYMNEELFEISDAIISSLRQVSGVVNLYQFYFQVGGETVRIYTEVADTEDRLSEAPEHHYIIVRISELLR